MSSRRRSRTKSNRVRSRCQRSVLTGSDAWSSAPPVPLFRPPSRIHEYLNRRSGTANVVESHPIAPFKVPPRVGDDFSVGRMIHGLTPNDSCVQLLVVVLHVPEQFVLRRRRTDAKYGIGPVAGWRAL